MKIQNLALSLIFLLLIISCRTVRIPDKPVGGNLQEPPRMMNSQINLPIEIDLKTIESYINNKLPKGLINSGSGSEGNSTHYSYEVYRNKPLKFSVEGCELVFKVPIDLKVKGSYTTCLGFWRNGNCCSTPNPYNGGCATPGATKTLTGETSPTVDVELRLKLEMQPDYTLKVKTYLNGNISGDTKLHVNLIGDLIKIHIDIKDKLEQPLKEFIDTYQLEIDKQVADMLGQYDIKKMAAQYWDQLQDPVPLGDFWLEVYPMKVIFENPNVKNEKLRIAIGIMTQLQVVSEKPEYAKRPLPNISIGAKTYNEFNLYLPVTANYDKLEDIIKKEVLGKMYSKSGISLIINDVNIQGVQLNNTNTLLISLDVKGKAETKKFKGALYFTALPGIDSVNKAIFLEDFKLETSTNSFLINHGLPFLLDNFFYKEVKKSFSYSYKEDYEKYIKLINDKLTNIQMDQFVLQGYLNKIELPGFYIDKESLSLLLIAKGVLTSTIKLDK
jgi:hypothetical protein